MKIYDDNVVFIGEQRKLVTVTFGNLKKNVSRLAKGLKSIGIKKGDRVVGNFFVRFDYPEIFF